MNSMEQAFLQEVTQKAGEAKLVCGWQPEDFLARLERTGPQRVMEQAARRGAMSDGFELLRAKGRLDLSPEAVVCSSQYAQLFEDETVNFCLEVLCENGYFQV